MAGRVIVSCYSLVLTVERERLREPRSEAKTGRGGSHLVPPARIAEELVA